MPWCFSTDIGQFCKNYFIFEKPLKEGTSFSWLYVATHLKKNWKLIKSLISLLLILITFCGFSQSDKGKIREIEIKSYQIESNLGKRIKTNKFVIDSAQIKSDKYQNKLSAEIKFKESGNKLTANIYFDADKIILIKIKEPSPYFKTYEDAEKQSEFYFDIGKSIDKKVRIKIPSVLHGVGMPNNLDKEFGYNQDLTTEYLMKLTEKIIMITTE